MSGISLDQLRATGLLQQLSQPERDRACALAAAGKLETDGAAGDLSATALRAALAAAHDELDVQRQAASSLQGGPSTDSHVARALAPPADGRAPVARASNQPQRLRAVALGSVGSFVDGYNSRALTLGGGALLLSSLDADLRIYDPTRGEVTATIPSGQGFSAAPVRLQNGGAVAVSHAGEALLLSADGALRARVQTPAGCTVLAVSELKDGAIVIGTYEGRLFVLDADGSSRAELKIGDAARDLELSARPDGGLVVRSPLDGVYLFDAALNQVAHIDNTTATRGMSEWTVVLPNGGVAVGLNEATFLRGARSATVQLFDAAGRKLAIPTLEIDKRAAPLLLDSGELAVADSSGRLTLLTESGAVARQVELGGGAAHRLVRMPSGELLVGTDDGRLHLVDPVTLAHRQVRASDHEAKHYVASNAGTIALLDGEKVRFFDAQLQPLGRTRVGDIVDIAATPQGGFVVGVLGGYELFDGRGQRRAKGDLPNGYGASARAISADGTLFLEQQMKLYAVKLPSH